MAQGEGHYLRSKMSFKVVPKGFTIKKKLLCHAIFLAYYQFPTNKTKTMFLIDNLFTRKAFFGKNFVITIENIMIFRVQFTIIQINIKCLNEI